MRSVLFIDKVLLKRPPPHTALRGVELFNLNLIRDLLAADIQVGLMMVPAWQPVCEPFFSSRAPDYLYAINGRLAFVNGCVGALKVCGNRYDCCVIGNVGDTLIPVLKLIRWFSVTRHSVLIAHRRPSRKFIRFARRGTDRILAVNQVIGDDFRCTGHSSVFVDYGITNADRFHPSGRRAGNDGKVHFGVVGAMENPWKGADTARAAFQRLAPEWQDRCQLHLASYESPPDIKEPNITAHHWMPAAAMPDFFRELDVLIVPSRDEDVMRETFSQAAVQGMLSGLPVIHSNLPVLTEKFDQGGGVAFFDDAELAHAITRLAGDPALRARLGTEARATALERYVWNTDRFIREHLFPDAAACHSRHMTL